MPDVPAELRDRISTLRHLDGVIDLLSWDEETYLPPAAREDRGDQLGALEGLRHGLLTDPRLGELLAAARPEDPGLARELVLLARRREREAVLPDSLVRAFAAARSRSLAAWGRAREANSFAEWAPALAELLALARERAAALARGGDPYDAMLDEHDPGMTAAAVGPVLRALGERLPPLVARIAAGETRPKGAGEPAPLGASATGPGGASEPVLPARPRPAWLSGPVYPDSEQEALCREILAAIGFDFARGRLDRAIHPFCLALGFHDVRLTNRSYPGTPLPAIFGALHEGGHGLYDQGHDPALRGTLLAQAPGMAIHESQSRLWENLVGRSRAFWTHWLPRLRARFPGPLAGLDLEDLLAEVRRVEPGYIRVDADEVTYNLHILLRFRLEIALLSGDLPLGDLPGAWNEAVRELLGLPAPDDLHGCVQDIHWALGAFGYFPSYTLGNLHAAQLHEAFLAACPDWDEHLVRGDHRPLLTWLRDQVHRHGASADAPEILARACGAPLSAEPFLRHIERRYLAGA